MYERIYATVSVIECIRKLLLREKNSRSSHFDLKYLNSYMLPSLFLCDAGLDTVRKSFFTRIFMGPNVLDHCQ